MKKTLLLSVLFLCSISCQESPTPPYGDDDTVDLFETVPPDTNSEQLTTLPVELDTVSEPDATASIVDPFTPDTIWPLETASDPNDTVSIVDPLTPDTLWPLDTVSFEPYTTDYEVVDTNLEDTEDDGEDDGEDDDVQGTDDNCSCHCHYRYHCHGYGNGHAYGHNHKKDHSHPSCQNVEPEYRCHGQGHAYGHHHCHHHWHCHVRCDK